MKETTFKATPIMRKPILSEQFCDNGEHSHWHLINQNGEVLWSDFPEETIARGEKILQPLSKTGGIENIIRELCECETSNVLLANQNEEFKSKILVLEQQLKRLQDNIVEYQKQKELFTSQPKVVLPTEGERKVTTIDIQVSDGIIDIQKDVAAIHHQYGISELANYKIQLLFEKFTKQMIEPTKADIQSLAQKSWEENNQQLQSSGGVNLQEFILGFKSACKWLSSLKEGGKE